MREYLRPATLFNATKFAQYAGQLTPNEPLDAPTSGTRYDRPPAELPPSDEELDVATNIAWRDYVALVRKLDEAGLPVLERRPLDAVDAAAGGPTYAALGNWYSQLGAAKSARLENAMRVAMRDTSHKHHKSDHLTLMRVVAADEMLRGSGEGYRRVLKPTFA